MSIKKDKFEEEKAKAIANQKQFQDIVQALLKDEKIKEHYKAFNPKLVEKMLIEHAQKKVEVLNWGPTFVKWQEAEDLEHTEKAFECFKQIQQKKLFDLQCQWRAELISLPGIEISNDFIDQGNDILNCKLIDPVTEADIDMFIEFIQSEQYEVRKNMIHGGAWQLYWVFKVALEGNPFIIEFPEWYTYHNTLTGNSKYLLLPDIRGDKESYYIMLGNQHTDTTTAKSTEKIESFTENDAITNRKDVSKIEPPTKPSIDMFKPGYMSWFVQHFENKDVQREFKRAGGERVFEEEDSYNFVSEIVNDLNSTGEILPIESSYDWRIALKNVLINFNIQKLKEAISPAFESYCMYIENGISFDNEDSFKLDSYRDMQIKQILAGRKAAGELEDLNF